MLNALQHCLSSPRPGKTILASLAIDHIQQTIHRETEVVAFHYYSYKDSFGHSVLLLIVSLLQQFIPSDISFSRILDNWHGHSTKVRTWSAVDMLADLLRASVSRYSKVYVVLDGLDELPHDVCAGFLRISRQLQQGLPINVLFFSRHAHDVMALLSDFEGNVSYIQDNNADISRDVTKYLESRLYECGMEMFGAPELKHKVSQIATSGAGLVCTLQVFISMILRR